MKLTSLAVLSLLAALSFAPPSLASSNVYVATGVDYENPWKSEFYFDSTKGSTLTNSYGTSVDAFIKAWKENAEKTNNVMDFTFLGKWEERIDKTSTWYQDPRDINNSPLTVDNIDAYAVRQLVSITGTADRDSRSDKGMALDGKMCWAHTAANMLQYWQCYYGVFATNTSAMKHGYAVENADTAKTMLGVQSLNTTKWYYDKFTNNGADLSNALGLYLDYDPRYPTKSLEVFGDYFSTAKAATTVKSVGTIEDLTKTVLSLMGVDKAEDGTISTNTYGQLIGLNIGISGVGDTGHSLTMYGFGLGENGQINRLIYADSNVASGLHTVYVKESNGALVLYEDDLCQKLLEGKSWQISNLMAINIPDSLKDMGRQYAENDLVWHGGDTWKAGQGTGSMAEAMPTDATGWQVSVNGTYYNSYFDDSRNVRFNDDGRTAASTVKISGEAKAHHMTIDAVKYDYTFTQSSEPASDSIALTGDLIKSGAATATIEKLGITAAGLSVKGGTLALGNSANLTVSGTSNVVRGGTLSMQGGTASLETANFAAGSVLKASGSTGSKLTASTLTFADGARFSFDLEGAGNTSSLLTIDCSNITFLGNIFFDFSNGKEDKTYNLISFDQGVGQDWLNNFVSYNGTLSFSGNILTLSYAAEKSATWTGAGETKTWSSSSLTQWSDTPEGASVTFASDKAGTVTVSGAVNPSAINVTGGSYVFVSDKTTPGSISGSRDITISGGASLESQMSLGEHAVVVKESSSFTYNVDSTGSIDVSELRLEDANSSATFKGKVTYDVHHASLSGKLSVQGTANLVLHSDADVASVTLADQMDAGAQLSFRNSSNSGMVQYTLATDPTSGTVNVGSDKDTFGTRLNVTSAATTYTVAKDSILAISGSGTTNFKASGEGTVLVDSGRTVTLAVSQSKAADGSLLQGTLSDVNFEVAKTATATLTSSDKNMRFKKSITVNGTLEHKHTYSSANSTVEINNLKLDSGTYKFTGGGQYSTIVNQVDNLEVRGSGTIYTNYTSSHSTPSYYPKFEMHICKLSGDGNIDFLREKTTDSSDWGHKGIVQIDKLDDFSGSIKLTAGLATTFENIGTIQNLVLGGGNMTGEIEVAFERGSGDWLNKANLVFSGDTTIGGLKSTALGVTTKYSANYDKMRLAGGTCSIYTPSTITAPTDGTRYTLTVKTQASSDDYTFTGHVGEGLNLAKHGEGKQSFVGDLSIFNGDVEVKGGTLVMTSSTENRIELDNKSNTTTLNTTSLSISGGATLESNLTVKVSDAFEARAYVSDLVGAAEATTFALAEAVGTNATENPVATVNAALDLSNAESLTFETGVNLGNQALTLWSGSKKDLTLSRSMGALQKDGTYEVTLFSGVASLNGASANATMKAQDLFNNTENLTSSSNLVYDSDAKTIVLTNVTFDTPEPTTATLALLGLMGLCARRRRQK